jgi:hypothetical protein
MRDQIQNVFNTRSKVKLTFTKRDGSTRVMEATQNPSLIPDGEVPSDDSKTTITVYDLENRGYRRVRYDSIISAE